MNQLRIEEAARLLRRTDQRVYEIATMVGYRDSDYFISRFEKLMGRLLHNIVKVPMLRTLLINILHSLTERRDIFFADAGISGIPSIVYPVERGMEA